MRSLLLLTSLALASSAIAQDNYFGIYSCTNYTSRGSLGVAPGEILLQVPATHFAGVAGDPTGTGTILNSFRYITQDQNGSTQETYYMVIRADLAGAPDTSVAGLRLRAGPLMTPASTVLTPVAWQITATLTTPSTAVPSCATFYEGMEVAAAPLWTNDGQSNHICTYYIVGTTQGDNPAAPPDVVPNVAWNINYTLAIANQPATPRSIRMEIGNAGAVLNMMNEDNTTASTCVAAALFRSAGAGGMWPASNGDGLGTRNDGLLGRLTDISAANGAYALFMSNAGICPGIPLPFAAGALHLNPGVLILVASGVLDAAGVGVAPIIPQGFVLHASMRAVPLPFQGATVNGTTFAIKLTNMAASTFL